MAPPTALRKQRNAQQRRLPALGQRCPGGMAVATIVWLARIAIVLSPEKGAPADMRVSGDTCNGYGALNGDYYYQGTTADGKHYYAHDTKTSHLSARYLYYDEDQDGPGEKGCGHVKQRWFIGEKPSTTLTSDLDGDSDCFYGAAMTNAASPTFITPPTTSTAWQVTCNGQWLGMTFSITPISALRSDDSGAPSPLDQDGECLSPGDIRSCSGGCPPRSDDSGATLGGDGECLSPGDIRSCSGGCPPRSDDSGATLGGDGECLSPGDIRSCSGGCKETTLQPGEGKLVVGAQGKKEDVRVSGDTCSEGVFNGDYAYQGNTADGKYYYAYDTKTSYGVAYLHYDQDQDGPGNIGCDNYKERWFIDRQKPSTTATSDLDGDGKCGVGAAMTNFASTTSLIPSPSSTAWELQCNGDWIVVMLTITPISPPRSDDSGATLRGDEECLCPDGTPNCIGGCKETTLQPGEGNSFYWSRNQ